MSDRFLVYLCKECGKPPKQKIFHSMPSVGGKYKNMYDLPSDRKWLLETKEGDLMGVCSGNEKLCKLDIILLINFNQTKIFIIIYLVL